MNRTALAAAGGAAGVIALVGAFAGGYALANGHTIIRTRVVTRTVAAPAVTQTRIVYRARRPKRPAASPSPDVTTVAFRCMVLQNSGQLEFNVTTVGGATYSGTVDVAFHDYAGSGHTFAPTTVQGATPTGSWHPVPPADIGASAEPSGCSASAG